MSNLIEKESSGVINCPPDAIKINKNPDDLKIIDNHEVLITAVIDDNNSELNSLDIPNPKLKHTTTNSLVTNSLVNKLQQLMNENPLIGWRSIPSNLSTNLHGWFRPGNVETLTHLITSDHKCIVELGSYLGASTTKILQLAPKALVFAVDIWVNEYFLDDPHYNKSDPFFQEILNKCSIYQQFLVNTKNYRVRYESSSDELQGLIPMKMKTSEALKILKDIGIRPDLIYIDASHHYDYVVEDLTLCLDFFPDSILVGDDWDNADVQRAVKDVARRYNKTNEIFVNGSTCWTFEKEKMEAFVLKKQLLEEEEVEKRKRKRVLAQSSFKDLLKIYKKS